jgi:V8-like Glu-specific endopeptidase
MFGSAGSSSPLDWQNLIVDIEVTKAGVSTYYEGTGALVGPNDVLTNAHVLINDAFSLSDAVINLYFGGKGSGYVATGTSAQYYNLDEFGDSSYSSSLAQYDLGVITVDQPIGEQLGWFGLAYGAAYQPNYLNVAGYPAEYLDGDTLYSDYVRADYNTYYSTIEYTWPEGEPGSSGSPLWVEAESGRYILGLNTLRSTDGSHNTASLFNNETFDTISQWIIDNDSPGNENVAGAPTIIDDDMNYWDSSILTAEGVVISAPEAQLYRVYIGAMGRLPDREGYDWWLNQNQTGQADLIDVANGFVSSDEFVSYADSSGDRTVSHIEFIEHMYINVFGREPDRAGYEWWLEQLGSGSKDQAVALLDMTQSNEYVELTLTGVSDFSFLS